ncbi:penicillin-binding protein [Dendrosporobacter sp. 1207_IL3150]|uniref:penicillin-binding protein n=1 Tax=Dendrosporobacter sp. 1207_IL3150 TaxID=3084054 RepID=UPI002FD8F61C
MPVAPGLGIQRRIAIFITLLLLIILVLAGRIAWVQFVDGKRLATKVQNQLKENKALQSPRGTIYDRQGRELAISTMTKSLYADPAQLNKDYDTVANLLGPALKMKPEEIKELLSYGGRFVWIQRMLEPEIAAKIDTLLKANDIKGFSFVEESKRYYPNDSLAAQILGFVGTDDVGLDGIELKLDKLIKGQLSEHAILTDNRGLPIFNSIFTFAPPKQGKNIYLTIDSTIQFIVEKTLDKAMATTRAKGAVVIVMNPRNGEVLAMTSRPTFNPNEFYRYSPAEWKNRAVSYVYEPGSTFKSIIAAAAIQEGLVTPGEKFTDNGYIMVSGRRIKNWSDESYGNITFLDVIKNSINTGFVEVGLRLGANRLSNYARLFGFGHSTEIGLPGEEDGILFNPDNMRESDLATMSIGQSIAVTPMQLVSAIAAIANDGVLVKPQIIKEIQNADGSVHSATSVTTIRQVISPETARTLTTMLEQVVSGGGGEKAGVKGYRVAGKTGTAEKLREDGSGYQAGHYIASFAGFAPAEDPQLAILVVIDDPDGIYYGGQIAAPVASEILGQVLRYINVLPQGGNVIPQPKPVKQTQSEASPVAVKVPQGKILVPNLTGKSIRQAGDEISKSGLSMVPVGTGIAVRQSIAANSIAEPGSEITVYFEPR